MKKGLFRIKKSFIYSIFWISRGFLWEFDKLVFGKIKIWKHLNCVSKCINGFNAPQIPLWNLYQRVRLHPLENLHGSNHPSPKIIVFTTIQ